MGYTKSCEKWDKIFKGKVSCSVCEGDMCNTKLPGAAGGGAADGGAADGGAADGGAAGDSPPATTSSAQALEVGVLAALAAVSAM